LVRFQYRAAISWRSIVTHALVAGFALNCVSCYG
jgi:hypothetical protein